MDRQKDLNQTQTGEETTPEEVAFPNEQAEISETQNIESQTEKKQSVICEIYDWAKSIAVAMVVALLINQFAFAMVQVEGGSMLPTLESKERLVVTKMFYKPKAKDIVVIKSHTLGKFIIKRVIAVAGDEVELRADTGDVLVNGEVLEEPYIKEKMLGIGGLDYPLTVPEGYVFVLGDNRNNSQDSRNLGLISTEDVVGRAAIRIMPFSRFGSVYNNMEK
ncbi:MAG: signal peptidase I [Ruminococcaceae bacterium]|nr:signal peptidase I [Oscillospiraceae bacterium]